MPVNFEDYSDPLRAVSWFDVDPTFDPHWVSWTHTRVYAYIPCLGRLLGGIGNFNQIAEIANVRLSELGGSGLIKNERLTADQIKAAAGIKKRANSNQVRPIRIDKALLMLYAVNSELDRLKKESVSPKIFLSAYNISGLNACFHKLEGNDKARLRSELAAHLDQSEELASDLLKGNKVSLDLAIGAHGFLKDRAGFRGNLDSNLRTAIETPTQKNTTASSFENFLKGRLETLPEPFSRPK